MVTSSGKVGPFYQVRQELYIVNFSVPLFADAIVSCIYRPISVKHLPLSVSESFIDGTNNAMILSELMQCSGFIIVYLSRIKLAYLSSHVLTIIDMLM